MVERRAAERRVGRGRQFREAQVGILDAQLRDVAEVRRQPRPFRRRHERAHLGGLPPAGDRRPARVGRVAVGEPVGVLAHGAEHGVLLPAQTRVVRADHGEQVGGRLSALGVAGDVALADGQGERQVQPREQALDLLGEPLVLHGELGVDRRSRRRHRAAAEEEPAHERDETAMPVDQPPRHRHLHGDLVGQHAELVEHLQVAALVSEEHLVAKPDRRAVHGAQRGVDAQGLEQREQVAGDRRQARRDAHAVVAVRQDLEDTASEQQARELRPPAVVGGGHHRHQFQLHIPAEARERHQTRRKSAWNRRSESWRTTPISVATGAWTTLTPSTLSRSSSTTTGRAPKRS